MASVNNVADPGTTCPVCAAPAQRGQLVCLECGSRITLGYRRPPNWKVPVVLTALVLLLTGAGGVLAYETIGDDAEREAARTPANPKEVTSRRDENASTDRDSAGSDDASGLKAPGTADKSKDDSPRPSDGGAQLGADDPVIRDNNTADAGTDAGGLTRNGDLYTWPGSLRAFTVVLLSAEDRPSASKFARSAGESSGDKVGVIRSNDFVTLPRGFFVVFAGTYPSRARADQAAGRLERRFPGAFAQLVRK